MKKYIVLVLFLLISAFVFSGCSKNDKKLSELELIKQKGYITVGVKSDSPPFGFYEDGILKGIDIEIAQRIANDIFKNDYPSNIKFVTVTAQNKISKLNSKEVDILVATMSISDKRRLVMDFSKPYYVTSQKILIPITSKITSLQYFNTNGTLAVIVGTTGEKNLRYYAPNARIIGVKTYIEAYKLLLAGQVDAVLGDESILSGLNNNKNYKILNHAYSREFYAVAVRKSKKSKELLNSINGTISAILDEKKINLLKRHYVLMIEEPKNIQYEQSEIEQND